MADNTGRTRSNAEEHEAARAGDLEQRVGRVELLLAEIITRLDALGTQANRNEADEGRAPRAVPLEPPAPRRVPRRIQVYDDDESDEEDGGEL